MPLKFRKNKDKTDATLSARKDIIKGIKYQLNDVKHSKNSSVEDDKLPHKIAKSLTLDPGS